jgi:putative salt-induced outer membrane protein YdiY
MKRYALLCIIFLAGFALSLCTCRAETVYLKNGDHLTGAIASQNEHTLILKTDAMGEVTIHRDFIGRIETASAAKPSSAPPLQDAKAPPQAKTARKLEFGYSLAKGNTNTEELTAGIAYNRNRLHVDETTFKANLLYGSSDKKMNAQQWYALGRYAFSFGEWKKWYAFGRMEASHNRFNGIDYRLSPALGSGYWLRDEDTTKFLLEGGLGLEHTSYRTDTKTTNEPVATPRLYFLKKLTPRFSLSQDLIFYQSLSDTTRYNLRSQTSAISAINERLSLKISLTDAFESTPPQDNKKNDVTVTTSLVTDF